MILDEHFSLKQDEDHIILIEKIHGPVKKTKEYVYGTIHRALSAYLLKSIGSADSLSGVRKKATSVLNHLELVDSEIKRMFRIEKYRA